MNVEVDLRARRRNRWMMIIILVMFLAPAIAAWVVYKYFPDAVRGFGTTNYGMFIQPTRPVDLSALRQPDGKPVDPDLFKDKWTMVYVTGDHCDEICRGSLYIMRQVRLTQGADMDRVGRLFVMTGSAASGDLKEVVKHYPDMTIGLTVSSAFLAPFEIAGRPAAAQAGRLYLVDPRGQLMMFYDPVKDPKALYEHATGIRKDLAKILHVTKIR